MSDVKDAPRGPEGGLARIPFAPGDEANIRSLAGWMTAAGWVHIALAVFDLLNLFATRNVGAILNALIKILIGTWCLQAASSFRKVATTDVADQSHLMAAFGKLRSLFLLQAIMVILGLVFVCAALLVLLVVSLAQHQQAP